MSYIASARSQPLGIPAATRWAFRAPVVANLWRELLKDLLQSYRPELHYMRGPGPRYREKHSTPSRAGGATQLLSPETVIDGRTNALGTLGSRPGVRAACPVTERGRIIVGKARDLAGAPAVQIARLAAHAFGRPLT